MKYNVHTKPPSPKTLEDFIESRWVDDDVLSLVYNLSYVLCICKKKNTEST